MIKVTAELHSNLTHSQPPAFTVTGFYADTLVAATFEGDIEELLTAIKKAN